MHMVEHQWGYALLEGLNSCQSEAACGKILPILFELTIPVQSAQIQNILSGLSARCKRGWEMLKLVFQSRKELWSLNSIVV